MLTTKGVNMAPMDMKLNQEDSVKVITFCEKRSPQMNQGIEKKG